MNLSLNNFFTSVVSEAVTLIKSLPINEVSSKLDNLYITISNEDFISVIKNVYKDLSPDEYIQKLIMLL